MKAASGGTVRRAAAAECTTPGFSLVEALIALALSGVILTLVATVFFAQNRFYADVSLQSDLQESVRSAAELVAGDVRGLTGGGVVVAEPARLVIRRPLVMGIACGPAGGTGQGWHAYFPFEGNAPAPVEVRGWAARSEEGSWSYFAAPWADLVIGSGEETTRGRCEAAGSDPSGPLTDFIRLSLDFVEAGDLLMLYSEVELGLAASGLHPHRRALYRGLHGSTPIEFATGVSPDTRFEYRLDGAFVTEATGSDLRRIDAVRIIVKAVPPPEAGSATSGEGEGWTVDIPLRNVD